MPDKQIIKALMLGDICGQSGTRAVFFGLPQLIKAYQADVVVVNGENAAGGFGLTADIMHKLFEQGVHVITSGNHIWQQEDIFPYLDSEQRLLRPANYAPEVPGHGSVVIDIKGTKVAVVNLQGRMSMYPLDCPFRTGLALIEKLRKQTPIILVDFHAEATEEKESLGFHLDGKVSAMVGTHTHVQTADEKILSGGTAYITDLGICGPSESVIGSNPDVSVKRQLTQMPLRNGIVDGPAKLQGIFCCIDTDTGKAISIERISEDFGA